MRLMQEAYQIVGACARLDSMVVKQTHLIAFLLVLAVAAGYFLQDKANDAVIQQQENANVLLCRASVARAAYIANGFDEIAGRVGKRASKGDITSAKNYIAVAESVRSTFPGKSKVDGKVERIEGADGDIRYQLTATSDKLISEGCRQAFKQ
jgi:TRAP-type uncharacterized transport system fused permease subunit